MFFFLPLAGGWLLAMLGLMPEWFSPNWWGAMASMLILGLVFDGSK